MTEGLKGIIAQLERQQAAIGRALTALREVEGIAAPAPLSAPVPGIPAARRTNSSARNRRSEGQRKRWAAKKAPEASPEATAPQESRITPEGRKRLADAMKRRWAAKKAAAAATKKTGKKRAPAKAA